MVHAWPGNEINWVYAPDGSEIADFMPVPWNDWANVYFNLNGRPIAKNIGGTGTEWPVEPFFFHTNAIGSTSMITWYNGDVVQKELFYPYGQTWVSGGSVGSFRFASLRELLPYGESGTFMSETRDYPSRLYRWLSPDPSRFGAFISDPQSWNMYTYAYNNPLKFVDRNGMWPTWIHNKIIDSAFPNLTAHQRQILKDVSAQQDSILSGGQGNSLAFQHGLRAPGQSIAEAAASFEQFVGMKENAATRTQTSFWLAGNPQLSDKALANFAASLHAILDTNSPAHWGFQVWNVYDPVLVAKHHFAENSITEQQSKDAVFLTRMSFNSVFYNPFRDPFFNPPGSSPPKEHVTVRICYFLEDGRTVCQ